MGGLVDSASAMLAFCRLAHDAKCRQGPSVCKGKAKGRARVGKGREGSGGGRAEASTNEVEDWDANELKRVCDPASSRYIQATRFARFTLVSGLKHRDRPSAPSQCHALLLHVQRSLALLDLYALPDGLTQHPCSAWPEYLDCRTSVPLLPSSCPAVLLPCRPLTLPPWFSPPTPVLCISHSHCRAVAVTVTELQPLTSPLAMPLMASSR